MTAPTRPGRVDVRLSAYRMLRMAPDPLRFRRRLASRDVTLVLDVSGSMARYSVWALAIAMAFSSHVRDLVLFSSSPRLLRGPLKPAVLAEALLSTSFRGLTDIAGALGAAGQARSKRVVVVTDLKQTVAGDVAGALEALLARGFRVVFIVPPSFDAVERARVEALGARVRVAYKPEDAAREVLRVLRR